jgi:hypothetical protein
MALSGHVRRVGRCPRSGAKRTWPRRRREVVALPYSIACYSANLWSSIRCPFLAVYARADSGGEAAALACPSSNTFLQ